MKATMHFVCCCLAIDNNEFHKGPNNELFCVEASFTVNVVFGFG